jgi:geranylgeranyl diphosphate synthase, type II
MPTASNVHHLLEAEIKKQKYGKTPDSLYEPIRYLMSLGGKRLRPMLTLLAYSLYKDDVRRIVPYAVAVEAFHNFTLMHDDIMDKAPLRRGHATVHKKWNVNTAILSGDVMLVKVYDMFLPLPGDTLKTILKAFNQCAAEVCEGQQWDMEFETRNDIDEKQYLNMIRLKTAVLLGFSLELGAILADAPAADCKALREFGVNIGIGFQLKDDLLDAYGDPKKFGKQVGGDILANKKTYLLIKALEKAKGKSAKELNGWLSTAKFKKNDKITAVKAIFDSLGVPALADKKINHFFAKGFLQLENVTADQGRTAYLKNFTEQLIQRQS